MLDIQGVRVIENANLVIQNGHKYVRRSWKERLLSWPWKPWDDFKRVPNMEPDPKLISMPGAFGAPTLVGHPETMRRLKSRLEGE